MSDLTIKKVDQEQQLVFGEVYAPGYPDSQGDVMTPDDVREAAYGFMRAGNLMKVDLEHDNVETGSCIVESFIARDDDPLFIPGSWVVGVHIPDPELWSLVKSGEINGFSMEVKGKRLPTEIELDVPPQVIGKTDDGAGHDHEFVVDFDPEGKFLGGRTKPAADGHWHKIVKGTVTEPAADGHTHRFSFVELLKCR